MRRQLAELTKTWFIPAFPLCRR